MNLPRVNREITASEVRLVDEQGEMQGVVAIQEAVLKAREAGLDLVEIAPKASPPVCKIIDFGKYKYEAKKNLQQAKKKQKTIDVKEVRLRPAIEKHDFEVKANQIRSFVTKGKKVKVSMRLRGREITRAELGEEVFNKLVAQVSDVAEKESDIKKEKSNISVTLLQKKE